MQFSLNAKGRLAQSPSVFAIQCCAPDAPDSAPHRALESRGRFPFLLHGPPAQPFGLLLSCAVAYGQSRNWPRCDRPRFQNSLAPQTFRASGTRAKSFLDHLFGIGAVPRHAVSEPENIVAMPLDEN